MPTDGADFGRIKACYGKAYTGARQGAADEEVAEVVVAGLERDIRRDGGLRGFNEAIELIVSAGNRNQLMEGTARLRILNGDCSLTRHLAAAAEKIGLANLNERKALSREAAEKAVLTQIARSRCCDGMVPYVAKNRTQSVPESIKIIGSIESEVHRSGSLADLARRIRNAPVNGNPAKAPRAPRVSHSAAALSGEVIGS
jgi:hypothetical protein